MRCEDVQINNDYINKLIDKNKWSQNELARRIGVSKGTMSRIITGKRGAGRKVISGLLRIEPEATYEMIIIN